jgi:hypothetical protein
VNKAFYAVLTVSAVVVAACGSDGHATRTSALPRLDSAHDAAAPLSTGGEAEWLSRAASVSEAAKQAESAVIATVTRVERGAPLVAAPDEINERRVVTLRVRDRWYGSVPDDFVINWLAGTAGEPAYQAGQDYVLFLVRRDDGPWYRPESPDGRVQILNGRLRPLIDGAMAEQVSAMTLAQVKQAASDARK